MQPPTQAQQHQLHASAQDPIPSLSLSADDPETPPDGGLDAWTQALMGHLVVFNTWGMIATFGVFQQHYTNEFGFQASAVSWIGAVQMLGHFTVGMFSGRAYDAGYLRVAIVSGMLLTTSSMLLTSFAKKYWQFFLAQGVMNGVGNGLQYTPAVTNAGIFFSKKRSTALAVVATGSATGGIIFPTIARQLLPEVGFSWTVRVMSFVMLAVGALYSCLLQSRLPPRKSGPLFELGAFKEIPYSLFLTAVFFVSLGRYFAFYYISSFATDVLSLSYETSINVLLVLNAVSILGRLVPSYLADRYTGPYNILIPISFTSALILYFWPLIASEDGLYGWAVLYGFFAAGFQGMFPAVMMTLTADTSKLGTRSGMGFAVVGLGTFLGPPISGLLIQGDGGRYLIAQMFTGSATLLGSIMLIFGRVAVLGSRLIVRG